MEHRSRVRPHGRAALLLGALALFIPGIAVASPVYKIQSLLKQGDPLGDTPFKAITFFEVDTLTDNGQLFFGGWTTSSFISGRTSEFTFLWDNGKITPIVLPEGEVPFGKWPRRVDIWSPVSVNQNGDAVFVVFDMDLAEKGRPASLGTFFWDSRAQKLSTIAAAGMPATEGLTFREAGLPRPAINNHGEIALVGELQDAAGKRLGPGVFFRDRDGKLAPVALPGQELPGGDSLREAYYTTINDAGRVAFIANGKNQRRFTTFLWEQGTLTRLAQLDTDAPGGEKIVAAYGAYLNNKNDNLLVEVTFKNADSGPTGLYLYSAGKLIPVAVPGQEMPGGGTYRSLHGLSVSFGNALGHYAFSCQLSNGTGAYLVDAEGKLSLILRSRTTTDLGEVQSIGQATSGSFGVGLNNKGQIVLPARIGGVSQLVLLTPAEP